MTTVKAVLMRKGKGNNRRTEIVSIKTGEVLWAGSYWHNDASIDAFNDMKARFIENNNIEIVNEEEDY